MPPVEPLAIPDDCKLLRRVHPDHVVPDGNTGKRRLSSGAFRDKEMSVDAGCLLERFGLDPLFSLRGSQHFLVEFTAGFARGHEQTVQHKPQDDNPVHSEVLGRKSAPVCNAFRDNAAWVKKPAGVE
jgi:hypothetical protein